ncbi:MAG: damage-control phosphatase ARMT1 family protein, partial [Candidatus Heimdallarchaeota archaeon]
IKCLTCMNDITKRFIDLSTTDEQLRKSLLDEITQETAEHFDQMKLPDYTNVVSRKIAERTGVDDPFIAIKKESNEYFKELIPDLVDSLNGLHVKDVVYKLFLYSIGANMVDFSTGGHVVDLNEIAKLILTLPDEGLAVDDFSKLYDLLEESQKIILLSDNCGEVVVDNLIADYLVSYRKKEVYLGLKGGPVANDCSLDDFKRDGLAENATETFVVSSTFGWNLNQTTLRFKELLETADVLIVKGQSNYETTLNNLVRHSEVKYPPTFCVLRTKCKVITKHLGVPMGSNIIKQMYPIPDATKVTEIVDCK